MSFLGRRGGFLISTPLRTSGQSPLTMSKPSMDSDSQGNSLKGSICHTCAEYVAQMIDRYKGGDIDRNLEYTQFPPEPGDVQCYICHCSEPPCNETLGRVRSNWKRVKRHSDSSEKLRLHMSLVKMTHSNHMDDRGTSSHRKSFHILETTTKETQDILSTQADSVPRSILTKEAAQSLKINWLDKCLNDHQNCYSRSIYSSDDLPSRLIHVWEGSENGLTQARLISTRQPNFRAQGVRYLTLSHAWGGCRFLTLQKSNIAQFFTEVPLHHAEFNKTFTEAITLTALLGYQYIWIDSLCIIQDSDNYQDWSEVYPRMGSIFENSDLTLAASGFRNGLDGIQSTNTRQTILPPFVQASDGIQYLIINQDIANYHMPLQERGWVLQEIFLSPRTLHFTTKGLVWECCELRATEIWPMGIPHTAVDGIYLSHRSFLHQPSWFSLLEGSRKGIFAQSSPNEAIEPTESLKDSLVTEWYDLIIGRYVKLALTNKHDKLPAVAGLGARFGQKLDSKYLRGHFEHRIIQSLLWEIPSWCRDLVRPDPPFAPSWSWAAGGDASWLITDWFKTRPIAKYQGSMDVHVMDATKTQCVPAKRISLRLGGFMSPSLADTNSINKNNVGIVRASIWRISREFRGDEGDSQRYEVRLTFSNIGNDQATQQCRPQPVPVQGRETVEASDGGSPASDMAKSPHEMSLSLKLDQPTYFESKISPEDGCRVQPQLIDGRETWKNITSSLAKVPPMYLLFLAASTGTPGNILEPGLGGLLLEKDGDGEDGPICRRLGQFRGENLHEPYGLTAEELAEQIETMEQSTVYIV